MFEKDNDLDKVRRAALDTVERNQKMLVMFMLFGAGFETLLLAGFLLLADFSNRIHVLLLIAKVASYSIIIMGLFALVFYLKSSVLRVLKAVEMLGETLEEKK